MSYNHSTLSLFRVTACRKCHPKVVSFLAEFKHLGLWGNVEDSTEFSVQKNSCGLCIAHCGYTLQISPVFSYNTDALLLREDYVQLKTSGSDK